MKRFLLCALLACPAMVSAENSIAQTYRQLSANRVFAGGKAVVQGVLSGYALYRGVSHGGAFMKTLQEAIDAKELKGRYAKLGDSGVVSGGMFYVGYMLACHAVKNARIALAI